MFASERGPWSRQSAWLVLGALLILVGGCERASQNLDKTEAQRDGGMPFASPEAPAAPTQLSPEGSPIAPPKLPTPSGAFRPSFVELAPGESYQVENHANDRACVACHAEQHQQWSSSAHAFASLNNPFYRVAFDDFLEDSGPERINFCAGCHDPAPMFANTLADGGDPADPLVHKGITCMSCHGVQSARIDGNASHVLSTAALKLPVEGDAGSLQAHIAQMQKAPLDDPALCISCHRGVLTPETGHAAAIAGINDYTPWLRSVYAQNPSTRVDDPIEPATCVDCHMPRPSPDGPRSHHFAGGHTTLAAAIGSEAQMQATLAMLREAATIDIAAAGTGPFALDTPEALRPGERLWMDVVVFNAATGHQFPGGALDLRDDWIEVQVLDAHGAVLASSGTEHEASGEDPQTHRLRALVGDIDGQEVDNHRVGQFRAAVFNHSVPPRDAAVVRYLWNIPQGASIAHPVRLEARLRHRRLHKPLHDRACETSRTERGQAFRLHTRDYLGFDVDPCRPQPVVDIDRATYWIGQASPPSASQGPRFAYKGTGEQWRRAFEHGLGLTRSVQESLDEARLVLERALALLGPDGSSQERAMVLFQLGQVQARLGQTKEALATLAGVEKLVGPHAAVDLARGSALQRVFQNREALPWLVRAGQTHADERTWRLLAISAASVGQNLLAYEAAQMGLKLEPRDFQLLRNQSLALRKLEVPDAWRAQAHQAYLDFQKDEEASRVRNRCSSGSEECLRERNPVHEHVLRTH